MKDINHEWNDGPQIRSKKQICGCHITHKKFNLCIRGKDIKKSVDSCYRLYQNDKDKPDYAKSHLASFEIHRKAYINHLATGADWPL